MMKKIFFVATLFSGVAYGMGIRNIVDLHHEDSLLFIANNAESFPNCLTIKGMPPLNKNEYPKEVIRRLLFRKVNPYVMNQEGQTALMIVTAKRVVFFDKDQYENVKECEHFIKNYAKIFKQPQTNQANRYDSHNNAFSPLFSPYG